MLLALRTTTCLVIFFGSMNLPLASAADKESPNFKREIQPLLAKYCVRCHSAKKREGKVDVSRMITAAAFHKNRTGWKKLAAKLKDGEMPPEKPLPTKAERKILIEWIESATKIDWSKVKHPGHVTIPRLTRDEYNNTLRDLLGVDLKPGSKLSADGEGQSGFNNDRDGLFISPAQMEKYFEAADTAISQLIALRAKPVDIRLEAEKMFMTEQNSPPTKFGYTLNRGQMTLYDSVTFPRTGNYVITVRAWSTAGPTGARLRINDRKMGDVIVPSTKPGEYTITCFVKAGTYQMAWNLEKNPSQKTATRKPGKLDDSDDSIKDVGLKANNANVTKLAMKNAPVHPPLKEETAAVKNLRLRLNQSAYALQRPYEWLRLHGPKGNKKEIARFKGYIADRTPPVTVAKTALAKALKLTLAEFNAQYAKLHTVRLADNQKILDAVKNIKPAAKRKRKNKKKKNRKPKAGSVSIDWIRIQGPVNNLPMSAKPLVFIAQPGKTVSKKQAAKKNLRRFAARAFRRPVTDVEIARYMKLFDMADQRGDSFTKAVKLPLTAILVSPNFLFRMEMGPQAEGEFRLNDYQLASRLSYYLWMTMPDDTLFELAAKNRLHEPAILRQQVARMMKDSKSHAFTEAFVKQWLGVGALGKSIVPDKKKFPTYTPSLQSAMIQETALFVDAVFREDRSLLELLDSRETFLNEELARHYGIEGVKGEKIRRVKLAKKNNRGGLLSMAGVLTVTSLPLRTSPVIRGKWVLETILGEEQPPPPANVTEIAKDAGEKKGQSLRQIYEQHRKFAQCASCHKRMDPIGFGFENFDAIGRWRDKQQGIPIDSSGVLPGGARFSGPSELKQILQKRKDDFARNLTRKLLSFALGRRLEYYDEPAILKASQALIKNGYKPMALVRAIVESYPFQYQTSRRLTKDDQ
jgi:hypothetical protein